jgi:sarcosine oxidase, subunit gamma
VRADAPDRDPLATRGEDLAAVGVRTGGRVTLSHEPFLAQVGLRLDPTLAERVPYPLPLTPGAAWEDGPRAALWLGPDEWMILGPPRTGRSIVAELEGALDGLDRAVVDLTSNRVALELAGPDRFELLSRGCPIDLHPFVWTAGRCAQTLLAKTQIILHERAETTGILVRTSFASYLLDWMVAAAETLSSEPD